MSSSQRWGSGQIEPLSADDWDGHMLHFLRKGYRVIAHDRRGRSSQGSTGHDIDHYADDLAALTEALDLKIKSCRSPSRVL